MIFPLIFPLYHYNITIIVQLYSQIPSWIKLTCCQFGLIVAVGLSSLEASHEAVDCLRSFLNLVQTRLRLRLLSDSDPRVGWVEQKNRCGPWQFDNLKKLEVRGAEAHEFQFGGRGNNHFVLQKHQTASQHRSLDGPEAADRRDAVQADLCQVVRRALSAKWCEVWRIEGLSIGEAEERPWCNMVMHRQHAGFGIVFSCFLQKISGLSQAFPRITVLAVLVCSRLWVQLHDFVRWGFGDLPLCNRQLAAFVRLFYGVWMMWMYTQCQC